MEKGTRYQIRVRGRLGETIRSAFPALRARVDAGDTVLTGALADQAALYGVLAEAEALLIEGHLTIQMRGHNVELGPGEMFVIPRGTEHRPFAREEARFLLVGPEVTSNTAGGKPDWSYKNHAVVRDESL